MANTKSAKKALRVTGRKTVLNKKNRDQYKEAKKKVLDFVKAGKKAEAKKALSKAFKEIDKAAKRNVIHKNKAARIKSDLSKSLNEVKKVKSTK